MIETVFHLPQNLWFTQNHRVKAGGDSHDMFDRAVPPIGVNTVLQHFSWQLVVVSKPMDDGLRRVVGVNGINFSAITGRQDGKLLQSGTGFQRGQGMCQLARGECNLLAQGDRRGVMIDSDNQ